MALVTDRTAECYLDDGKPLAWDSLQYIVLHRTSLARPEPPWNDVPISDDECDAAELAARFRRSAAHGYQAPYHLLVLRDASIEQMLPLTVRGTHARGVNSRSIAIAYVGHNPTPAQVRSIVRLCALLVPLRALRIVGHMQLPGASVDPRKVCPGEGCSVPSIVASVVDVLGPHWRSRTHADVIAEITRAGMRV